MPKDLEPRPRVTPRSVASVAPHIALPVGSGNVGPAVGPAVGGPVAPGSPVPMERLELGERMDLGDLKDPKFMPVPPSVPMMVVGTPSPKQASWMVRWGLEERNGSWRDLLSGKGGHESIDEFDDI